MTDWSRYTDGELLAARICDLGLDLEDDFLSKALTLLERELTRKGFRFRPHVWLSDEWFCPDGVPGFAIPFYLAHPRLRALERRQMLEVEGGTLRSCLRLLRHETGHALDNAFRLRRIPRRRRLFGKSETEYPDSYVPEPFSRKYVRHLDAGYAQSHPDEDFAETFAVWLDPRSGWRKRYAGWPARDKLVYMDALMGEISARRPALTNRRTVDEVSKVRRTLGEHYRLRRERYQVDFSEHYDVDLTRVFGTTGRSTAADFLRRRRAFLRRHVSDWTGYRRYTIDSVIRDWIVRARELKLRVKHSEAETLRNVTTLLTVRVTEYVAVGGHRIPL